MTASLPRTSPWWAPDRHADRRPFLVARARIKAAIRQWFDRQGFIEVETACLQVSPGNEAHLHAFKTEAIGTDLSRTPYYLHTSPEFACKKLLAAGETKIFTFAPCFRNRERGALHAPEFTMLEWYRVHEPYGRVMDDAATLVALAAETAGEPRLRWRDKTCDAIKTAPERLTVSEAFHRYAGIDLMAALTTSGPERDELARAAQRAGVNVRADDSWSDLFSRLLATFVEPNLGSPGPCLLCEYPAIEAAFARPKTSDPRVAERFELYCCGVELANGFGELTDAVALRINLESQMVLKEKVYGERYPIDDDFLAAVSRMPPSSGCALGFDRLVTLATGATHIDQVLWTPPPDPEINGP